MNKRPNRIKYTCETCHIRVWGKYNLRILCGHCDSKKPMTPELDIKPFDFTTSRKRQPREEHPSFKDIGLRISRMNKKHGKQHMMMLLKLIFENLGIKTADELKPDHAKRKMFWQKLDDLEND